MGAPDGAFRAQEVAAKGRAEVPGLLLELPERVSYIDIAVHQNVEESDCSTGVIRRLGRGLVSSRRTRSDGEQTGRAQTYLVGEPHVRVLWLLVVTRRALAHVLKEEYETVYGLSGCK